jgi:hypothetical protein
MKIHFFKLSEARATGETGSNYPQIEVMISGYDYDSPNSIHNLAKNHDLFSDYKPNLDSFILTKRAKLTDLLSDALGGGGHLISHKFYNILSNLNLSLHKCFPATILDKFNNLHYYYYLYLINDYSKFVDYKKSIFFIYHNYAWDLGIVPIKSKEDFILKEKELKQKNPNESIVLWAKRIILSSEFNANLDLFKIGNFNSDCFISKRLKNLIIENRITGCEIKEADNLEYGN